MGNYLLAPVEFLISTLFGLYILAVMLRFLLQRFRADFYNPISQFLVKVTNPPLRPLRRVIPGLWGFDMAAVVLMLVLQLVSLGLIVALRGIPVTAGAVLIWSVAELISLAFNVFIFAILIQAILSWVNPHAYNPAVGILHSLTDPVLRPIRNRLSPVSGIDLSPLVAILGLQVAKMLVVSPLMALAQ